MTKVLIYIRGGIKRYAIVAPNGVKMVGAEKWITILGASKSASFQMSLFGGLTEKQFRNKWKVIGSFMVEAKQ
jgi:hypothetical protein